MSTRVSPPRRSPPSHPPQSTAPQTPIGTAASRFLAPVRLSEAEKRRLIKAMVDQHIGDLPSCALFTGAAEYEVGTFHRYARLETAPAPAPETPPPTTDFSALKTAADHLLGTLEQTPGPEPSTEGQPENPWTLARLRRLRCELNRLVKACNLPVQAPGPAKPVAISPAEPVADVSSTRRFVRSLARTFGECFDQAPTLAPDSPFRRALALLTTATGIRLGSLELPSPSQPQGIG